MKRLLADLGAAKSANGGREDWLGCELRDHSISSVSPDMIPFLIYLLRGVYSPGRGAVEGESSFTVQLLHIAPPPSDEKGKSD